MTDEINGKISIAGPVVNIILALVFLAIATAIYPSAFYSETSSLIFVICWVFGAFCSLSFGPMSDILIFGRTIFDFFDNLSSNILMTLGSLMTVLFVGWRLKKTDIYDEFTNGGTLSANVRIFGVLWFLIRYIAPLAIIFIFLFGLLG
jgi:NSS family neurotransmitter:Na+ symporter